MTWGEFKAEMEKQGVKDDMKIDYMDFNEFDAGYIGLLASISKDKTSFNVH